MSGIELICDTHKRTVRLMNMVVISLIVLFFCTFYANVFQVKAADDKDYVLYISSYSYSWESVPLQIAGVQEALGEKCVINYEFMDTKNVTYSDNYKEYYEILKYKLSQRPAYDAVIVGDDAALKFVRIYQDELFLNIPIAFNGVDNLENAEVAAKDPYICGVGEKVDYKSNVEIAKKLCPQADKIVFINDKKENGEGIAAQLANAQIEEEGYEIIYLVSADYTRKELESKLQSFDDSYIVFCISLGQGKGDVVYTEDERMDILEENVHIPIFRVSSENFGNNFIGGFVIDHRKCAYMAGMMINEELFGSGIASQEVIYDTPSVYCFDQALMKQYGISMSLLPDGTIIKNPIPTFLQKHYTMIIYALVITAIWLLLLILALMMRSLRVSKRNNRKMLVQANELQKAMQAKTDFLSRMSHEMRTPLNSILGSTHLAKEDLKEKKDLSTDLEQIEQSGKFLLNLINDILDASRIEADRIELHKEWCDPGKVLNHAVNMMIPIMDEKNLNFIYPKVSEKIGDIECYIDPRRVEQMIINLLNNAYKFTPEGGTITFKVENIGYNNNIATDKVTISDTGCGMTKEFIEHIGEPFKQEQNVYSSQSTGSGLGVFIVRKIAEMMGGSLEIESEVGKGSSFSYTISYEYRLKEDAEHAVNLGKNMQDGQDGMQNIMKNVLSEYTDNPKSSVEDASEIEMMDQEAVLSGTEVLYAEDNEMNQLIGKRLLERKGMHVTMVSNGQEAVELFQNSEPGTYDIILMDMRMPVMSGMEATEKIRGLEKADSVAVPIIALSADAIPDEVAKARMSGLSDYLTKPIDPEELYHTIAKWKGGH